MKNEAARPASAPAGEVAGAAAESEMNEQVTSASLSQRGILRLAAYSVSIQAPKSVSGAWHADDVPLETRWPLTAMQHLYVREYSTVLHALGVLGCVGLAET